MATRPVGDFYDAPGVTWGLRQVGPHLHPGSEDATVYLAGRAQEFGFPSGRIIIDLASALGAPSRYLARRFWSTIIAVDMDPRMHRAAVERARAEEIGLLVQPVLARAERLPLGTATIDAAWSQDALCHMTKAPVIAEVARVLRPGATFAFSDWVARRTLEEGDRQTLRALWAFPELLTIAEYVALLAAEGFEVVLAEDRTAALSNIRRRVAPADQELWLESLKRRFGPGESERQGAPGTFWNQLVRTGKAGHAVFVARLPGGGGE